MVYIEQEAEIFGEQLTTLIGNSCEHCRWNLNILLCHMTLKEVTILRVKLRGVYDM